MKKLLFLLTAFIATGVIQTKPIKTKEFTAPSDTIIGEAGDGLSENLGLIQDHLSSLKASINELKMHRNAAERMSQSEFARKLSPDQQKLYKMYDATTQKDLAQINTMLKQLEAQIRNTLALISKADALSKEGVERALANSATVQKQQADMSIDHSRAQEVASKVAITTPN